MKIVLLVTFTVPAPPWIADRIQPSGRYPAKTSP